MNIIRFFGCMGNYDNGKKIGQQRFDELTHAYSSKNNLNLTYVLSAFSITI